MLFKPASGESGSACRLLLQNYYYHYFHLSSSTDCSEGNYLRFLNLSGEWPSQNFDVPNLQTRRPLFILKSQTSLKHFMEFVAVFFPGRHMRILYNLIKFHI